MVTSSTIVRENAIDGETAAKEAKKRLVFKNVRNNRSLKKNIGKLNYN